MAIGFCGRFSRYTAFPPSSRSKRCITLLAAGLLPALAARLPAQSPPQQFVYGSTATSANTSAVAGFSKDSKTGALSAVIGAPFNERLEGGSIAIDGLGRFLFVLNPSSNNISMFQINTGTGAIQEVPNSPFSAVPRAKRRRCSPSPT